MSEPTWTPLNPDADGFEFGMDWTFASYVEEWSPENRGVVLRGISFQINGREVTEEEYRAHFAPKRPRFWRDPFRRDS